MGNIQKQVKVESDGTSVGTRVIVDGKELKNVLAIYMNIQADKPLATVSITLVDVPVVLSGKIDFESKIRKLE